MRSEIVRQFVSRPPSQRWLTYGMPTRFASLATASCACFFVPTNSTVPPRCGDVAHERVRLLEQRERLREIDDVDAAALAEDEPLHLRVPAAGLVAEVDSGLQELLHGDDGHEMLPSWFGCSCSRRRRDGTGPSGRHHLTTRPAGSDCRTVGVLAATRKRLSAASSAGSGDSTSIALARERVREREPRRVQELAAEAEVAATP